jgi:hypothetical protein
MSENRLQIISEPIKKGKEWMVFAQCQCGSVKEYRLRYIKTGHTKSCGCILKTHGLTKHPLFKVWQSMKERCYNVNHTAYKNYGARGITICEEWLLDVEEFINWGLKNGWGKGLELDRRSNDGAYDPDNCRFVTPKVNARNRRSTININYGGVTKPLVEWAEEYNLPIGLIRNRLKRGWDTERVLTRPISKNKTK